ncbi:MULTISPECIES: VOC family protein [Exiguobacterium]|uniref:VOC family protein n=1 Tax=Exiguobacterium alkaliphilum TaxID=1428684 RepID=A0ABT2KYL3_9BACL|nr:MULTISPECIES: VOC family protein [Exiguobacterium]MCT4795508.1 VOC family protein [Exiguobacterium alkaliphilum]QUE86567.1 VOC family protein [Exiguobacterium alkaliphilum]
MLHHVELYVSDLKKSLTAWDWLLNELGYTLYQQWDKGQSYKFEKTYLVFVQTEPEHLEPPYHRKKTGLNHLAFHADSLEQLERLRSELPHRGFTELYADRFPHAGGPNYIALYFEDPDRMKVELVATL